MNGAMPREGSKVRLIGLKNPGLNGKLGTIASYSRDGERVMISLVDGPQGLVKVKPKQIEVIEEPGGGGGGGRGARPGLHRRQSSQRSNMRDRSRDSQGMGQGMSRRNTTNGGSQRRLNQSTSSNINGRGSMRRAGSNADFRDNASQASQMSQEVMETLRSADAMFDLADTSGDGMISQEEFEYYMEKHTNHDSDMIRECFYMIDVDGNGDISRDEVRNAFLKKRREVKGGSVTSEKKKFEEELTAVSRDADMLFDRADVDRNGTLSIREFELYMKRHTSHSDAAIHDLFDTMDVDNDGYITREEVRRAYMDTKKEGSGQRKSLAEVLGLDDEDMAEIEDDVYNMFFLADSCSQSWWFAVIVFIMKVALIIIIAIDLWTNKTFPKKEEVTAMVKTTQFLLLPVNVAVQEELITTFYIYANLKWSRHIRELSPGASKTKFHIANLMRFLDGLAFIFINTTLLLQATDVLGAFLNFAALQFLSSIDNVALHLARDGYLTENLETVAGDVLHMRLPKNHNDRLQVMDSLMLLILYLVQLVAWVMLMFVLER